jgi:hypothetical protein
MVALRFSWKLTTREPVTCRLVVQSLPTCTDLQKGSLAYLALRYICPSSQAWKGMLRPLSLDAQSQSMGATSPPPPLFYVSYPACMALDLRRLLVRVRICMYCWSRTFARILQIRFDDSLVLNKREEPSLKCRISGLRTRPQHRTEGISPTRSLPLFSSKQLLLQNASAQIPRRLAPGLLRVILFCGPSIVNRAGGRRTKLPRKLR